jgi:hypothetical protein
MENFTAIRQYIDKKIEDGFELFLVPIETIIESYNDWEIDKFRVYGSNSEFLIGIESDDYYRSIQYKHKLFCMHYDVVLKCEVDGVRGYEDVSAILVERTNLSTLESVNLNISLY